MPSLGSANRTSQRSLSMFSTRYQRKRTSEADKRACFVCYKPTDLVLLNENPSADFFYCCEAHLTDKGFAKPDGPPPAQKKLDQEIEDLKKEWDNVKPPIPPKPGADENDSKPQNPSPEERLDPKPALVPVCQWYTLDPQIHRLRVQHKSQLARQKKTAALLRQPLPQAPTHDPK